LLLAGGLLLAGFVLLRLTRKPAVETTRRPVAEAAPSAAAGSS
jgi:hypothetical protein